MRRTLDSCPSLFLHSKLVTVLRYDTKSQRLQKLREEYLEEVHHSDAAIAIRGRYILLHTVMRLGDDDEATGWGFMVIDWISALACKIRGTQDVGFITSGLISYSRAFEFSATHQ